MAHQLPPLNSYPGVTHAVSATLDMKGTASPDVCVSTEDFLRNLMSFNKKITKMISILDTKEKTDKIALELELSFAPTGSTYAYLADGVVSAEGKISAAGEKSTFTLRCYCNGGS